MVEKPEVKIREWDIGKPAKNSQPMTQEEWVANRRKTRHMEFAPPSHYGNVSKKQFKNKIKQTKFIRDTNHQLSATISGDHHIENENVLKYNDQPNIRKQEFAPPSTYEYYGPSGLNKHLNNRVKVDPLERAISKGLANIRKQS